MKKIQKYIKIILTIFREIRYTLINEFFVKIYKNSMKEKRKFYEKATTT